MTTRKWFFILLLMVCLSQSGCELLSLPGQILSGMFGLAGQALGIASTPTYFINGKMVVGAKSLEDELKTYFPGG